MASQEELTSRGDILVVDDTPANLRLLAQVLQGAGYRVRTVTSGARGLAAARLSPPALLLLDVRMPDLNGVEVCARLKADPLTSHVPVIFISAFDDLEAKVGAFSAGGVDYIVKPISPEEVLARVATHLALRELHQRLQVANDSLAAQIGELARANADLQRQIGLRQAAEDENARLLDQERRRALRLDALRGAMTAIARALDLPSVREAVLAQAMALLGAEAGAVAHPLAVDQRLRIAAVHGLPPGVNGLVVPWGQGLVGQAAATRQIVSSANGPEPLLRSGSALSAPLIAGDSLEGVVVIANPDTRPPFDDEDLRLLDLFAQQAAIALQNARLFEELRHQARTDPLTGLSNRRHFYELAQRELERVRRAQGCLAILLLDVDHFKHVNDGFGHQAGDQALRGLADLLQDGMRAADVSARYGGEELVVLLPDTNLVQATAAAERLRRAVNKLVITTDRGAITLPASIGVAALERDQLSTNLDTLLARADEACYAAKRDGRDRVVTWTEVSAAHDHA